MRDMHRHLCCSSCQMQWARHHQEEQRTQESLSHSAELPSCACCFWKDGKSDCAGKGGFSKYACPAQLQDTGSDIQTTLEQRANNPGTYVQGTLAQLDSKSPVMYIEFPLGRLKLFGTLVFPQNKSVAVVLTYHRLLQVA